MSNFKKELVRKVKSFVLNRFHISAFDSYNVKDVWNKCLRFSPEYFYGFPSLVYLFACDLEECGINGKVLGLKVIICTGEKLYSFQKDKIKNVFGCPVVVEYGATEMGVIGFECPEGNIHLTMENIFVEKKEERIFFTNLINFSMPIMRYNLGDRILIEEKKCSCGRETPIVKEFLGRKNEFIISVNNKKFYNDILEKIMKITVNEIKEIKILQVSQKELEVSVSFFKDSNVEKLTGIVLENLSTITNNEFKVSVCPVSKIVPENSGKKIFFSSKL